MSTHAEYMRMIIDEINGVVNTSSSKPTVTPPNTTGIGIALNETKLNDPMAPGEMPYPSFMHELVAKHPEIKDKIRVFNVKDRSGWIIKPRGDSIDTATFETIRDACLEKNCKITKTKDGDLDITKSMPLPVDNEDNNFYLSILIDKSDNPVQLIQDLEALIGKTVYSEENNNGWHIIWRFPNAEEALDAQKQVNVKYKDFETSVYPDEALDVDENKTH